MFVFISMDISFVLLSAASAAEADFGWNLRRSYDGQLCRKYQHQKLLKYDTSTSSYNQYNAGTPVHFNPYFVCSVSPGSAKADVGW